MTATFTLKFVLKSDATFGRGDGVAGLVDQEVEHDALGLPFLRGRTLKGLLEEECASILYAVAHMPGRDALRNATWVRAAQRLFGGPGSSPTDNAIVHYSDAVLPADVREAVAYEIKHRSAPGARKLQPMDVLESLTAIRRQTAMDALGVPVDATLRSMRVIVRETPFQAEIGFMQEAETYDLALLAACVKAFRRAGTGRNRGRGRLAATLWDAQGADVTDRYFAEFRTEVGQ